MPAPAHCRFLLPAPPHLLLRPFRRAAQKLSVGAGMCASLAATSAFLEAVNLTMGPTAPVSYDEKRTFCGCPVRAAVGWTGSVCAHTARSALPRAPAVEAALSAAAGWGAAALWGDGLCCRVVA